MLTTFSMKDGNPSPEFKEVLDHVRGLGDGAYVAEVRRLTRNRSNPQNRFLNGVVYKLIADHFRNVFGWEDADRDMAHDVCRARFLSVERGHGRPRTIRSTRSLSTGEMTDYWQRIQIWARNGFPEPGDPPVPECGLLIPDPNQIEWMDGDNWRYVA